ncbi:MAG: GspH/FimT family pseudopilin [Gammaproteobacteria bacterium]|nr:GspH/FimT family pseudopilin [Gammaproteobacteria bacterium]
MTLAIATILVAFAIPSFRSYVQNTRVTSATNDLVAALNIARAEGIIRQEDVVLCSSTNSNAPTPACGGSFSNGWIVFNDCDGDGAPTTAANVCLGGTIPERIIHAGQGNGSVTSAVTLIRYQLNGMPSTGAQDFDLCVGGAAKGRRIGINNVGRVSTGDFTC